jgi:hypothetical protein
MVAVNKTVTEVPYDVGQGRRRDIHDIFEGHERSGLTPMTP